MHYAVTAKNWIVGAGSCRANSHTSLHMVALSQLELEFLMRQAVAEFAAACQRVVALFKEANLPAPAPRRDAKVPCSSPTQAGLARRNRSVPLSDASMSDR